MELEASYHQERLWFIDRFEAGNLYPGAPVYHNIPVIVEIAGELIVPLLERSLNDVVSRHEALRTRIVTNESENRPQQFIQNQIYVPLRVIDIPDGSKPLETIILDSKQPFSIDSADHPLLRAVIVSTGENRYMLGITLHHLIADRWSLQLLLREMFQIYDVFLDNRLPDLPEPPIHYADFSMYQQELPTDVVEPLLFYWNWQLGGELRPLELPVDFPPRRRSYFS